MGQRFDVIKLLVESGHTTRFALELMKAAEAGDEFAQAWIKAMRKEHELRSKV